PSPAPPARAPAARSFRADARQLFEALRMGVVPPALLDRYTVEREEEIKRLRSFLRTGRGILVFQGHYGAGKTHFIELAASEALKMGFLVSRVSFDPVEVPPSNPQRVYREVIHNLRYPPNGSEGGLLPLLSFLSRSAAHRRFGSPTFHRYLSPALFAVAEGDPDVVETVLAFVEGRAETCGAAATRALRFAGWRGPKLLALPDYRTFGQVYLYVLGGIASWAHDAGHKGLVVLFDEAESMDSLETTSREFADTFLRYFAAATLPESELAFRPSTLRRGGQAVHREIPHVYRADQPLAALFAFTPLPRVEDAVSATVGNPRRIVELEPLSTRALPELAERLRSLYVELHPDLPLDERGWNGFVRHVESGVRAGALATTRAVARLTVEWLDLLRHGRDAASALAPQGRFSR
ncbi:MAG: BREX system ATP-binding domain-containing protein, partial [Planctomycetota bacterium]